ncbi:MAG: V-type ATP synthase subunit I [Halosimplex sp.]
MLRPKQMSKVSVTGSKAVMDDVVETVHDLHLVHFSDYDGHWPGFDNGDPMAGGEDASEKLVTVRSLKSILGVEPEDAGPSRIVTDETLETELEEIRTEANDLDDRRSELESDLREVDEEIDAMDPFATLGIDLDLLWGYDSLAVSVGEGDADSVERALSDLDVATETFAAGGVVAAFAHTDEDALQGALVEANFTAIDVPHEEGDPEDVLDELRHRKQQLESKLRTVEDQIEELRYDTAGFLLAAEEKLSIRAQKAEAPLLFATTENAFVAEGWIPTERVEEFEIALDDAVGDHVDVEVLEVASYNRHGHPEITEGLSDEATEYGAAGSAGAAETDDDEEAEVTEAEPQEARADGGVANDASSEVRSDGGTVTMNDDDPPVIQDNPGIAQPFELLTKAVGRPNYSEFDPTIILLLTFPAFFGFMIADVGYGAVYMAVGLFVYTQFDSQAFKQIGLVGFAAGFFTSLFGFFFGEIFGLHLVTTYFWEGLLDTGVPLHKGLAPNHSVWALAWFIIITLVGVLHLNVAYILEFIEGWNLHGAKEAVIHTGSWLLALNGIWLFIFSRFLEGPKPDFLFQVLNHSTDEHLAAIELGFGGLPAWAGILGLAMMGVAVVLLAIGPSHELVEFHVVLAHPLSYLRIGAELLAEVGLAFAINLLFWGGYAVHGEHGEAWHFGMGGVPEAGQVHEGHEVAEVLFPGLVHMGPAFVVIGLLVLALGTFIVLALGIMSVGIQAIRLEYFEFFEKFYEGNGATYTPFGSERTYTTDDS